MDPEAAVGISVDKDVVVLLLNGVWAQVEQRHD